MTQATFETKHFTFEVYAENQEEALSLIQSAWSRHVFTNEAAHRHPRPDGDNVEFLEFELGDSFRDGEPF